MWRRDFLWGSIDVVDAERGQFVRLERLRLNCRLSDRVKFIEELLEITFFEDDVLAKLVEKTSSMTLLTSLLSSLGVLVSTCSSLVLVSGSTCSCSCGDDDRKQPILVFFVRGYNLIFGSGVGNVESP